MAKKIKEQIDYGNTPERMSPSLERKISNPESPFATNPAFPRKEQDVQKIVTNRFKKVADKLRGITGEPITSQQVFNMLGRQMMSDTFQAMNIERGHVQELENLAVEVSLDEIQMPADWFEIEAHLNRGDNQEFRLGGGDMPKISKGEDIDVEMESHKRNIINAIIQGTAKKGHYVFQKPEVRQRLNAIDPRLYNLYLSIMAINDFLYFTADEAIEQMANRGQGVGGSVKIEDSESDDEDGDGASDTVIKAYGAIFPILCHEIIKGLEEAKGRYGFPEDEEVDLDEEVI